MTFFSTGCPAEWRRGWWNSCWFWTSDHSIHKIFILWTFCSWPIKLNYINWSYGNCPLIHSASLTPMLGGSNSVSLSMLFSDLTNLVLIVARWHWRFFGKKKKQSPSFQSYFHWKRIKWQSKFIRLNNEKSILTYCRLLKQYHRFNCFL